MVRKKLKETTKTKNNKGERAKREKEKEKEVFVEKPANRVDIDLDIYRGLFKYLEEKLSVECFIDLHGQCYGRPDCGCECHTKK